MNPASRVEVEVFWFSVGVILSALLIFIVLSRVVARENGLMDYFEKAAAVYLWLGEEAAADAAHAAAKIATRAQRDRMAGSLTRLSADLPQEPPFPDVHARSCRLVEAIQAKDWRTEDAVAARQHLAGTAPDYAEGLGRRDPEPFLRRYPLLFGAGDFAALADAADREKSRLTP